MNDQLIPKEAINESINLLLSIMPIAFIIVVMMTVIWLRIIKLDGKTVKNYIWYEILIVFILAILAYLTMPNPESLTVEKLRSLIISVIGSGFALEIFRFWREYKSKKNN